MPRISSHHGVVVVAGHDAEPAAVAAAVADAAPGRQAEGHLLAAAGLEEIDIGRGRADERHGHAARLGLAQGFEQGVDIDAGFAEQEHAVGVPKACRVWSMPMAMPMDGASSGLGARIRMRQRLPSSKSGKR